MHLSRVVASASALMAMVVFSTALTSNGTVARVLGAGPTGTNDPTFASVQADAGTVSVQVASAPGRRIHDPRPVRTRRLATQKDPVLPSGVDVGALSSRPGAARTIYLDFTGGVVPAGTVWTPGGPFPYRPYTADGDPTAVFSAAEQATIHAAWATVVEDFAAFDVNVTTSSPGPEALVQDGEGDDRFGVHVAFTPASSSIHEIACRSSCGGVAAVGGIGHLPSQPVWVFTTDWFPGISLGGTASHEIGHALGLLHDGHNGQGGHDVEEYYVGNSRWSPIMGASHSGASVTHWSAGEYPGATRTEDDLALIGRWLPPLADDHADATNPTPVAVQARTFGVMGARADVDAFAFIGSGKVSVVVTGATIAPNLDLDLTLVNADGTRHRHDNTPVAAWSPGTSGLDAVVRTNLGQRPRTMVAVVDGAGQGDWASGYSDYSSLGRYTLTVVPGPTTSPRWHPSRARTTARARQWWQQAFTLSGSAGDLTITHTGSLPKGLRLEAFQRGRTVRLSGRPRRTGVYRVLLKATDGWGDTTRQVVTVRVEPRPPGRRPPGRGAKTG